MSTSLAIAWSVWNLRLLIVCLPLAVIGFFVFSAYGDDTEYLSENHPIIFIIFALPTFIILLEVTIFLLFVLGTLFLMAGEI